MYDDDDDNDDKHTKDDNDPDSNDEFINRQLSKYGRYRTVHNFDDQNDNDDNAMIICMSNDDGRVGFKVKF